MMLGSGGDYGCVLFFFVSLMVDLPGTRGSLIRAARCKSRIVSIVLLGTCLGFDRADVLAELV